MPTATPTEEPTRLPTQHPTRYRIAFGHSMYILQANEHMPPSQRFSAASMCLCAFFQIATLPFSVVPSSVSLQVCAHTCTHYSKYIDGEWYQESHPLSYSLPDACAEPITHTPSHTIPDACAKPITDLEAQRGRAREEWLEGGALGYPPLRAAGQELGERGVAFLDASGVFRDVEETLYIDACHFDARGNELLAQQIGAKLAELVAGSR